MYHHHSQPQGPQPFSNGPKPPHLPPKNQRQTRPASGVMSQVMDFPFPRATQLPDELESALAIHGARDVDHRHVEHMSRQNQTQNQSSVSGISQHGSYSSNTVTLTSDNQPGHQQGVDWSSYQPPTKLFTSPPPNTGHQPQLNQGPQQRPQSSHPGPILPNWTIDSPATQARHPHGGCGDGMSLYTAESAGSILASFGLSNEDLEVLSHYPDDQLTPDTLPFILRDIQISKSGNQKNPVSSSTSASSFSHTIHDMPLPPSCSSPIARSHSPEVPSLLAVTQTAGKVIDYGHASRAKDESNTRETFKREQLSSERTVKLYPSSLSSSTAPKGDKGERRQMHLEHTESSKHGDRDYRRTSSDHHRCIRSPGRDFPPSSKPRNLDRDYRHDRPKPRLSPETRTEASSRRAQSSSAGSNPQNSNKKLPTPTMISDFSAATPKVYPHTCSLCHIQCDQEKDWVDHINTVNHTAACRDLRNKYPDWKPNPPSRSGQYSSRTPFVLKDDSPSHSRSRSLSCSPPQIPPHSRHRQGPCPHKLHGRPYSPRHQLHYQHYAGGPSHSGVKRQHNDSPNLPSSTSRHPPFSKSSHSTKHGSSQSLTKTGKSVLKPGIRTTNAAIAKAADTPSPAKKKKKVVTLSSQDASFADHLIYLTGIPNDASEQEVTDLVGSFGKINNVILMPCTKEENARGEGQKASVCMVKVEDAQALANSKNLSIRDQQIIASVAKKPEAEQALDANYSKPGPGHEKGAAGKDTGFEVDPKISNQNGLVLITGLPESGWSESDVTKLVQPFGTSSDVILATQLGKVLLSVPDMEVAEEMVKVNSFFPMKIKDYELKMIILKQSISLFTPVALYNLLMGSEDPLESSVPVSWSSLLVIRNVPNTPSASSEVQKLVQRFGTVIKTLVLNSMVICEMATAAMALSVYKRFQAFPCIIQNNPLFFSRKPDSKTSTKTKVIPAYLDSSEDTPANSNGSKTATAAHKEESSPKEGSECSVEGMGKDGNIEDEEVKNTDNKAAEDEALRENGNKEEEDHKGVPTNVLHALNAPEADVEKDMRETSAEDDVGTEKENKEISEAKEEHDKAPSGIEAKPSRSAGIEDSLESAIPELPKVTQEVVNELLVKCQTNGEQVEIPPKTEQATVPAEEREEIQLRKQEREQKERELRKEKEKRERRAKKEREFDERARRDQEKREEERWEWERRERMRREKKRVYDDRSRSSYRLEGYWQSSWRDERHHSSEAETKRMKKEEEEEFDQFIFNMSDFVTLDEVGDVTDLPHAPSPTPMETTEEDPPTLVQKDAKGETPIEIPTETIISDDVASPVKSEYIPKSGCVMWMAARTPETALIATEDSVDEVEALPTATAGSLDCSSTSLAPKAAQNEEDENQHCLVSQIQAKVEEMGSDKTKDPIKGHKETGGKNETSGHQTNINESVKENINVVTPASNNCSLPPFNPSNPVGLEFLVPKTGFFCKACNRFFSGSIEAEISHCKTFRHYENLQNYLQTKKTVNVTTKPACN